MATRLPILSIVCEDAAVQSEGQAVFSKVTPHAFAALGHHPWYPRGLKEVHLKIWLGIWGQGAPSRLHNLTAQKLFFFML